MALTKLEEETIYKLAEEITGTHQQGEFRKDILARNVEKRIAEKEFNSLEQYLELIKTDPNEYNYFINDLTIHTTSWFREDPHFKVVQKSAAAFIKSSPQKTFKVWSAACSSGEEVYSIALSLAQLQEKNTFEYSVHGSDIDPICIKKAQKAIYQATALNDIGPSYKKYLLVGENKAAGMFTLDKSLRDRAQFFVQSLNDENYSTPDKEYNVIFCRNVLIYFETQTQAKIIAKLISKLAPDGILILGHCDSFPSHPQLKAIGNSSFQLQNKHIHRVDKKEVPKSVVKHQVLVIDDSPTIRLKIKKSLSPKYIILEAESAAAASLILAKNEVSFITLDLNMPGENGATWLQKMRSQGLQSPVVIVSDSSPQDAERVFGALSSGAQDYLIKSKLHSEPHVLLDLANALIQDKTPNEHDEYPLYQFKNLKHSPQLVVAGASTGGPEALNHVFSNLPKDFPPLVIVQHISAEFSRAFMNRLCQASGLKAGQIADGKPLQNGYLYLATGDYHLKLQQRDQSIFVEKSDLAKVQGHRPSVDTLFSSLSDCQIDSVAILLTGMGSDGAQGLRKLVEKNRCYSLVQDANSSVVFGMPKKAIQLEAACFVGNLNQIRSELDKRIRSQT